jgi:hypothetical protein
MVGVKEVDVDGQVTQSSERRVPSGWLTGAVERGLVLQRRRSVSVWDPSTGLTHDTPGIEAADAVWRNSMVACPASSRCGRLVIVDAETASTVVVRPPGSYGLDLSAEFSPDGSLLAAPAIANRRWRIALVNTSDGTSTILPGSRTGKSYPDLSWSASSGWLFFRGERGRVMAYRPGEERAVSLPFRLPRQAVAFMAG